MWDKKKYFFFEVRLFLNQEWFKLEILKNLKDCCGVVLVVKWSTQDKKVVGSNPAYTYLVKLQF